MLKNMTLKSLDDTKVAPLFNSAVAKVIKSFDKDRDVAGARSITMKISFTEDDGIVIKNDTFLRLAVLPYISYKRRSIRKRIFSISMERGSLCRRICYLYIAIFVSDKVTHSPPRLVFKNDTGFKMFFIAFPLSNFLKLAFLFRCLTD